MIDLDYDAWMNWLIQVTCATWMVPMWRLDPRAEMHWLATYIGPERQLSAHEDAL